LVILLSQFTSMNCI